MTRLLGFIFLISIGLKVNSQNNLISGVIIDYMGQPLDGALICQGQSYNCRNSDINGAFHLTTEDFLDNKLVISLNGYLSDTIRRIDTISGSIKIVLVIDPNYVEDYDFEDYSLSYPKSRFAFVTACQVDFVMSNFNEFSTVLEDYNVKLMNMTNGFLSGEFGVTYKKFYTSFNLGGLSNDQYEHDSLNLKLKSTQFGLHFGYCIIDTKRFLVTPKVGIRWYKYRLLNTNKEKDIPIEQYLTDRDLDIRLNQATGFVGLNLSYKFYDKDMVLPFYYTFGMYCGYLFKINSTPWVYSKQNKLITDKEINFKNYTFGYYFSININ